MENLKLSDVKRKLFLSSSEFFGRILLLPLGVRPSDKYPSGIQVLVRVPGTRNLIFFSVCEPSDAAQVFAVEKAVRSETLGHTSSQNSQDWERMKFPGSVTVETQGIRLQASTSGMTADEDVACSVIMLARTLELTTKTVCEMILKSNGELPNCFNDQNHYLHKILFEE